MTTRFKEKLLRQEQAVLLNPDFTSAALVHQVAQMGAGADAIMIDCEQGTASFDDIGNMTRAARLNGLAAIVRVPSPEPWTIERYLSCDVDGIVVPRLDSARQVAQAVADIRYCTPKNFLTKAVIIQVESVGALQEIDEFLAVPGIDCFFIGAVDLAKSMGFSGNYGEPAVHEAILHLIDRIRTAGKSAGGLVKEGDVRSWQAKGINMPYFHVLDLLAAGSRIWREHLDADRGTPPLPNPVGDPTGKAEAPR